jgi:hypothetical protein
MRRLRWTAVIGNSRTAITRAATAYRLIICEGADEREFLTSVGG